MEKNKVSQFTTYKHIWMVDSESGITRVVNRKRYPLNAIGRLAKKLKILSVDEEILRDPSLMYDGVSPFGQKFVQTEEHSIQIERADSFLELLLSHGVDVRSKSILDLSGGSGEFVVQLKKRGAAKVVHTEFSQKAVQYARNNLGIESHLLDLNKQRITSAVGGGQKFDIVLLRGLIEFCDDLEQIAADIHEITHTDSLVLISHQIATLGVALRTQFDQYNMSILRPSSVVSSTFEKHGFRLELATEQMPFDRDFAFARMLGPFAPFYLYYLGRALLSSRDLKALSGFHSLECKARLQLFRRD